MTYGHSEAILQRHDVSQSRLAAWIRLGVPKEATRDMQREEEAVIAIESAEGRYMSEGHKHWFDWRKA